MFTFTVIIGYIILFYIKVSSFHFKTIKIPSTSTFTFHNDLNHKNHNCLTRYAFKTIDTPEPSSNTAVDLTNYSMWITFEGFSVKQMDFGLELLKDFKSKFTRGLSARELGYWRTIKMTDGGDLFETTHPILPEMMYFFDILETNILWRGKLDMVNMKIYDGEVITNKKRLGIFPYTEILATFTGKIYNPNEKLPVEVPKETTLYFAPPVDFETPYDMKRYPEIFDPEFVDWWFANENALSNGKDPVPRPKNSFFPKPPKEIEEISGGKAFKKK